MNALDGLVAPAPASLVLVSPAIGISPAAAVASCKAGLARLPGLEKLAWTQILPEFDAFNDNSFTSNAGDQVHRLIGHNPIYDLLETRVMEWVDGTD